MRERNEDGYIGVTAIGIMMLLLGTSIILLGAVSNQVNSARASQEYTNARQGLDGATASALTDINTESFSPYETGSGTGLNDRGEYEWSYDPSTRLLTSVGRFRGVDQESVLPLRWYSVGSKATSTNDTIVYGVAANASPTAKANAGVWAHGLTSGHATETSGEAAPPAPSVVAGTFETQPMFGAPVPRFDYALFGDQTRITVKTGAPSARPQVLRFADSAVVDGDATSYRSHINLQFDRILLDAATSNPFFRDCIDDPANTFDSGGQFHAGTSCTKQTVAELSGHAQAYNPGAPAVIIVKGSLRIPSNLNSGQLGQMHIYVTGDVNFTGTGVQDLDNVFIYAPNGRCKTTDGGAIHLTGSLACKQLDLPNEDNKFVHVTPKTSNFVGAATKTVYYTESFGHVDTRTP